MPLNPNQLQFIQDAIAPAQASQSETGVPASVTMAQAILESGWGEHHMGDANNYFGIKAFPQSDGSINYGDIAVGYVEAPTREFRAGEYITITAYFRQYASITDSFRDHGYFLRNNARYAGAFASANDPDEFARRIHRAAYATAPDYADVLISLMRSNNLYQYDQPGAVPSSDDSPLLRRGDQGQAVATLQQLVIAHGAAIDADGDFGPATEAAVRAFQAENGLDVDGIVGPQTWEALRRS